MADNPKNIAEITRPSNRKEWTRPRLRKLPIAATAGGSGKPGHSDEGMMVGKGDTHGLS
jgi:hypothetical protein